MSRLTSSSSAPPADRDSPCQSTGSRHSRPRPEAPPASPPTALSAEFALPEAELDVGGPAYLIAADPDVSRHRGYGCFSLSHKRRASMGRALVRGILECVAE